MVKGLRQDRAMLMNYEEDYDDEKERLRTHPFCLPKVEGPVDAKLVTGVLPMKSQDSTDPKLHRRSVFCNNEN